jgi:hypothetical protein
VKSSALFKSRGKWLKMKLNCNWFEWSRSPNEMDFISLSGCIEYGVANRYPWFCSFPFLDPFSFCSVLCTKSDEFCGKCWVQCPVDYMFDWSVCSKSVNVRLYRTWTISFEPWGVGLWYFTYRYLLRDLFACTKTFDLVALILDFDLNYVPWTKCFKVLILEV